MERMLHMEEHFLTLHCALSLAAEAPGNGSHLSLFLCWEEYRVGRLGILLLVMFPGLESNTWFSRCVSFLLCPIPSESFVILPAMFATIWNDLSILPTASTSFLFLAATH